MARTDADDRWVVELLDVQPNNLVLEVGFGPGVAIALIAERTTSGFVAGVDPSDVMLHQATRRNRAAIRQGRVELHLGTVADLPYPDARFTKACSLHTLYFWPSVEDGLRELHRVLSPGGLLVLAVRMRRPEAGPLDPSRYGYADDQVAEVVVALDSVGFHDVTTQRRDLGRQTITAILARR
jgi:ubiquinone/menaquinone biosynthesis C-methylase UbiE